MNRLIFPCPVAFRGASGSPLSLGWFLRLLTLLVGVMSMHLWIGPGSNGMAGSIFGSSPVAVSATVEPAGMVSDGTLDSPSSSLISHAGTPGAGGPILAAVSAVTALEYGSSDTSLCAETCPNGHSMMTVMCLIAFLVIGAFSFLWFRSTVVATGTSRRGPPARTAILRSRPQTVSLVHLSISRT